MSETLQRSSLVSRQLGRSLERGLETHHASASWHRMPCVLTVYPSHVPSIEKRECQTSHLYRLPLGLAILAFHFPPRHYSWPTCTAAPYRRRRYVLAHFVNHGVCDPAPHVKHVLMASLFSPDYLPSVPISCLSYIPHLTALRIYSLPRYFPGVIPPISSLPVSATSLPDNQRWELRQHEWEHRGPDRQPCRITRPTTRIRLRHGIWGRGNSLRRSSPPIIACP